jgi:hypothetical protein
MPIVRMLKAQPFRQFDGLALAQQPDRRLAALDPADARNRGPSW